MTPERLELVEKLFGPYGNFPEYAPALELIEHAKELQAFVRDLAEGMTDAGQVRGELLRRTFALHAKICPARAAG